MIPTGVVIAFFLGLAIEGGYLIWTDLKNRTREARFWEDLRRQVLDDAGPDVFDWATLEDPPQ